MCNLVLDGIIVFGCRRRCCKMRDVCAAMENCNCGIRITENCRLREIHNGNCGFDNSCRE